MAEQNRELGTFRFSANFETRIKSTLDARQLVDNFSDLLLFTEDNFIPTGFVVAVKGVNTPGERGLYQCRDENNITDPENWVKIGGEGVDALVQQDVIANLNVGGIKAGDIVEEGSTLTEFVIDLLTTVYEPDLISPSFSLTRDSSSQSLKTIGSTHTFNLIFNFNKGSIIGSGSGEGDWNPTAVQGPRAGEATTYDINGETSTGNTVAVVDYEVQQGINSFTGTVTYEEGPQPLNSNNEPFNTPLPQATSPERSTSFEGVYPIFATSENITTFTQQPLRSMLTANNIEVNLFDESGGNKQAFEIPMEWLDNRDLQKIEYYSTVQDDFTDTNQIGNFQTTDVTKTIEGNTVSYRRFTHTGPDRGDILIRLIF